MNVLPMIQPAATRALTSGSGSTVSLDTADESFVALLAEALAEWISDDAESAEDETDTGDLQPVDVFATPLPQLTVTPSAELAPDNDVDALRPGVESADLASTIGSGEIVARDDAETAETAAQLVDIAGEDSPAAGTEPSPETATHDDQAISQAGSPRGAILTGPGSATPQDPARSLDPAAASESTRITATDPAAEMRSEPGTGGEELPVVPPSSDATTAAARSSATNVTVQQPVTAPTPVAAPSEPASVAAAMADAELAALDADDPWQQLATVIRPLRVGADGTHRIALQLRPAELGTVHLEVALEDGILSMRAVAETVATRDVIAGALPELRAELTRSGIALGDIEVGDQTTDGAGQNPAESGQMSRSGRSRPEQQSGLTNPASTTSTSATAASGSGRLDLSL